MNILYHLTILPPKIPGSDAVVQDIQALKNHFGGELVYLNPNRHLPLPLPRVMFGLCKLRQLRAREIQARIHLHHVFNPDPFPFPVLKKLRQPVLYTLTGGVGHKRPNLRFFSSLTAVTVSDKRSLDKLRSWGLANVHLVRPGIDTERFTRATLPLRSEIKIMVGSAPWSRTQFQSKGIDALLTAAQHCPQLRLVFLWRGILAEEMKRRVQEKQIEKQVKVLNKHVDVNHVLSGVHASITLATTPEIIRSYPHSLMESLAAGKPILVSRCIPMADYVQKAGCGHVVESTDTPHILGAIKALRRDYPKLCQAARQVGKKDFAQQQVIASFQKVYENILDTTMQP